MWLSGTTTLEHILKRQQLEKKSDFLLLIFLGKDSDLCHIATGHFTSIVPEPVVRNSFFHHTILSKSRQIKVLYLTDLDHTKPHQANFQSRTPAALRAIGSGCISLGWPTGGLCYFKHLHPAAATAEPAACSRL